MLHPRALALQRPALCRRFNTCLNVATCRPKVLQSLDLHAAEESEVEGLGIIPQSWGTPAGRLLSQGEHVCDLDALKHLVSCCSRILSCPCKACLQIVDAQHVASRMACPAHAK
jgi:hypothetical protein